jgi:hypothetical protein
MRLFQKTRTVILSEAKNLFLSFQVKKSKKEILQPYGLRMTRKGKFTKILEHPPPIIAKFNDRYYNIYLLMEDVAQQAEHKVVALGVAGSSPVILPCFKEVNKWIV